VNFLLQKTYGVSAWTKGKVLKHFGQGKSILVILCGRVLWTGINLSFTFYLQDLNWVYLVTILVKK